MSGRTSGGNRGSPRNSIRNGGSQSRSRSSVGRRPTNRKSSGSKQGNGSYGKGGNGRNQNSIGGGSCPGGNIDACVDACVPIQKLNGYRSCVTQCGKRC